MHTKQVTKSLYKEHEYVTAIYLVVVEIFHSGLKCQPVDDQSVVLRTKSTGYHIGKVGGSSKSLKFILYGPSISVNSEPQKPASWWR